MRKVFVLITVITVLLIQGCTTTGKIYTGKEGEKFDPARSGLLGIGAAIIYEELRKGNGLGGGYGGNAAAWDYLPGSGQWRCRDTGGYRGGEFVPISECRSQRKVDNWP